MKAAFETPSVTVFNKSCHNMSELQDNSVQAVITSPPYWGLRKYADAQDLIWGGENNHEHEWGNELIRRSAHHAGETNPGKEYYTKDTGNWSSPQGCFCTICGAWRGAFGLEPTADLYVQHSIQILREIRRVLRKDGVCFWNIGDSYAGSNMGHGDTDPTPKQASNRGTLDFMAADGIKPNRLSGDLKPKDLCLIPFRVALAAQADGWWVRSVIIWNKLNPMPESVKDRPTESHEYILMLTKSARYFWDIEAVKELTTERPHKCGPNSNCNSNVANQKQGRHENRRYAGFNERYDFENPPAGRNLRSVWSFSMQPFHGSHFATFPEKLPETCIKAVTSESGCCAVCGKPLERVIEPFETKHDGSTKAKGDDQSNYKRLALVHQHLREHGMEVSPGPKTIGWKPSCNCQTDKPPVPCTILDPFAGSGTTLMVATKLGRKSIGYEISAPYIELIKERCNQLGLPPIGV